ncbi:hypothetical protein D3C75_1269170 [compost metagenome]
MFKARYGLSPKEVRNRPHDPALGEAPVIIGGDEKLSGFSPDARKFLTIREEERVDG